MRSLFLIFFLSSTLLIAAEENVSAVIIGGGVGGGTSALYLSRAGLRPVVITGTQPGGALSKSSSVENWPGLMQVRGEELVSRIQQQAEENGAVFLAEEVVSVDFSKRPFTIVTRSLANAAKQRIFRTNHCIIATGSTPNHLGVPGEEDYWGRGVTTCAVCDGALYKGRKVGVVGGGDSALLEALYLSNLAEEVTVFVRKDRFRAVDEKRKELLLSLPNVKVLYQTTVQEILGDDEGVTSVVVKEGSNTREIPLDGLFLAIGSKPNTSLFKGKLALDSQGYIILKNGQETSVPQVFAIGDVSDPLDKQAISAAGDGAKAALAIQRAIQPAASSPAAKIASSAPVQIIEITSTEHLNKELSSNELPLLVDFYATWCSPCTRVMSKLQSAAETLNGKVRILKVNIDKNSDLARTYQIRSLPTVLLFKKGVVVERKIGENQISDLLSHLADESVSTQF